MQPAWYICSYYFYVAIFAIKKIKAAKSILNKKALAASTTVPALQFSLAKTEKQVYATSLSYSQWLPPHLQSKKRKKLKIY